jgi:hypothetical protein
MTNEKIQLIREKCIAANSEIMQLKFGCEVISGKTQFRILAIKDGVGLYETDHGTIGDFTRNTIFDEILGRPIRLADVLLASGCNTYTVPKDRFHSGDLLFSGDWQTGGQIVWNLRADDLEKQSEETISFIYELLK